MNKKQDCFVTFDDSMIEEISSERELSGVVGGASPNPIIPILIIILKEILTSDGDGTDNCKCNNCDC